MIGADATTIGTEIERKFLLRDADIGPSVVAGLTGTALLQGYFRDIEGWSVRLRKAGGKAWLTMKSRGGGGAYNSTMRWEVESPVDPVLAGRLLDTLPPERCIVKTRYRLPLAGSDLYWEIDRFEGRHAGLWLAEIELPSADHPIGLPDWLGAEVTRDPRYSNANLAAVSNEGPGDLPAPLPGEIERMARRLLAAAGTGVAPPPEQPPGRDRSAGRRAERALRQARLEQALRANLQRRKQQVRGREPEPRELEPAGAAPALDRDDPAQ